MISIVKDVDDFCLKDELWSGAVDTLEVIIENNKLQDLLFLLEDHQ